MGYYGMPKLDRTTINMALTRDLNVEINGERENAYLWICPELEVNSDETCVTYVARWTEHNDGTAEFRGWQLERCAAELEDLPAFITPRRTISRARELIKYIAKVRAK